MAFLVKSFPPVTRAALHVHHGNNPDDASSFDKNDRVRKITTEMPAYRRVKNSETIWLHANLTQQPLHLAVKAHSKFG
jgi:hypothetical protein